MFREYIARANPPVVDLKAELGTVLPFRIELQPFPAAVAVEVPSARGLRFVRTADAILVVDPDHRKVLQLLPLR